MYFKYKNINFHKMSDMLNYNVKIDHYIKLLIIGDSKVGKSSFIKRFLEDAFSPNDEINAKELESKNKILEIDNQKMLFHVWDGLKNAATNKTTKSELSIRIQGIIIMYDVSNYTSFDSIENYINQVKEKCGSDMPIIVIGNKNDLDRVVNQYEGEKLAKNNNVEFIETSVYKNINIDESIIQLANKIIRCSYFKGNTITLTHKRKFKGKKKKKYC